MLSHHSLPLLLSATAIAPQWFLLMATFEAELHIMDSVTCLLAGVRLVLTESLRRASCRRNACMEMGSCDAIGTPPQKPIQLRELSPLQNLISLFLKELFVHRAFPPPHLKEKLWIFSGLCVSPAPPHRKRLCLPWENANVLSLSFTLWRELHVLKERQLCCQMENVPI